MSRRKKTRDDGTPVPRRQPSPRPKPSDEDILELEALTETFPEAIKAFRDLQLLSPARRISLEQAISNRTRSLALLLHGIHDPHNQAAIVRTSEAMGFQELHVTDVPHAPWRPSDRVTQSAHKWVDVIHYSSFEEAAKILRARKMQIMATALIPGALPVENFDASKPTALVLGTEARGLPQEVLAMCDGAFSIPLYGLTPSLNVSVAAAIITAYAVDARRKVFGKVGDLSEEEMMELRVRFYAKAAGRIPPSLANRLNLLLNDPEHFIPVKKSA